MADIRDLNLKQNKKNLLKRNVYYILSVFLYTLLLYPIFTLLRGSSPEGELIAYFFGLIYLLPHHAAMFIGSIFHLFAYYYNKKYMIYISRICDWISLLWLGIVVFFIIINLELAQFFMAIIITVPLILAIITLLFQTKRKEEIY